MDQTVEVAIDRVHEEFFDRGWTDGLPVIPPTPELVHRMMEHTDAAPDEVLGSIARRHRSVTVQQAAVNAVMAGCKPEYFPVVVAALAATLDPAFNANAAFTSTGGAALCVVVSGPGAAEIGMNARHNALGSGNRANATIGRAVRLVAMNVFGARTGALDATAIGHPGKYTMCFAESDPLIPWEPLRVTLGYDIADTTVTVMATEGPRQIANHLNDEPEGVLRTFASAMKMPGIFAVGKGGQGIVVLGPEHALAVRQAGWTQQQVREFLCAESRVTPGDLEAAGVRIERGAQHDMTPGPDGMLPAMASPDDVYLVTAGGEGAGWSAYIPSMPPAQHARAVTRRVRVRGEAAPDCGAISCAIEIPGLALAGDVQV